MAKVVLVNPAVVYAPWGADLNTPSPDVLFLRLGLAGLSASLKERGHEVRLIDLRTISGWSAFDQAILHDPPDVVGVSVHSVELSLARLAARRAKHLVPGVITVAGGPHPTVFPEDLVGSSGFDYVIRGEGEISFPDLIEDPGAYPPLLWGKTPDLDRLPYADRELWPDIKTRMDKAPFRIPGYRLPLPMAEMINTRGCPYQCTFCFGPGERNLYTRLNKTGKRIPYIRGRSVEHVMGELKALRERYGIRSAMFHDDHFLMKRSWVEGFCRALHDEGFVRDGFRWITSAKADGIRRHEDLVKSLAGAGLEMLIIGFESFSPRVLKWFNKRATREDNREAARICREAGIKIWANYILGIPTPTGWHPEDDLLTVEGVLEAGATHYSPAFFTPIPGSLAYSFYREKNLILGSGEAEDLGNRGALAPKLAGVDYDFLESIMVTDTDLAAQGTAVS